MSPTLGDGDIVFLESASLRFSRLRRGEVVGFRAPRSSNILLKRVVGLPGDIIEADGGEVFVRTSAGARHRLSEPYVVRPAAEAFRVHLAAGDIYVLGDNRRTSIDSRAFGPISRAAIVGQLLLTIQPPPLLRRLLRH
jgi:signal peptidase I